MPAKPANSNAEIHGVPLEVAEDDKDPQSKGRQLLGCRLMTAVAVVACLLIIVMLQGPFSGQVPKLRARSARGRAAGHGDEDDERDANSDGSDVANPIATLNTTMGIMKAEIFLDRVPVTASNFIDLSMNGFYDGIHFHRVIPGFMAQFGCPYAKDPSSSRAGTGGPPEANFVNARTGHIERRFAGGNIQDELISRDSNLPGTLAMANTGAPNSGGSQFFINVNDNSQLDWFSPGKSRHPVFGKLTAGYNIAEAITKVKTSSDRPNVPIRMNSITIAKT